MNIKALITTLVLGSSSMASADSLTFSGSVHVSLGSNTVARRPVVVHDSYTPAAPYRPAPSAPVYRPLPSHQVVQPVWHAPVYNPTNTKVGASASEYKGWIGSQRHYITASNAWYDITEPTRIDSGRQFFMIGADNGAFRAIRLEALGNGRSQIRQVAIEFADAQGGTKTQVVKLNSWIGRGNSSITIDLEGNYRRINRITVYGSTDHGSAYKLMAL